MPTYDLIVEAYMPNLENLQKAKPSSYCVGIGNATIPSPHKSAGHLPRFLNMPDSEILCGEL